MSDLRVSRRTLLKIIAASGGSIVASSVLPGKWLKPSMRVGVLPVHAQTSDPQAGNQQKYQIVDTKIDYLGWYGCIRGVSATISPAHDGVRMKVVICLPTFIDSPCWTLFTTTNAGAATFEDTPEYRVLVCYGNWPMDITVSFADPKQAMDGSGSVKYHCDGQVCTVQ